MRRIGVSVLVVALLGWLPQPGRAQAADPRPVPRELSTALRVVAGSQRPGDPSASIALRDLFSSLPRLSDTDRAVAEQILARPTDGDADPYGDGYRVRAVRVCSAHLCVHRVRRTADRASPGWARTTLRVLERVWQLEVERLGFRPPLPDGRRGGDTRFDVYLAELGADGLFGYCAPERKDPEYGYLASGYCVLDQDFARAQYRRRPLASLRVTAAHEFFHALQYAYDYDEDRWFMEATATWMEEQIADAVNDNRRYLAAGQLVVPEEPLDTYEPGLLNQYGNWVFFEFLSNRLGRGVVRRFWETAGAYQGAPDAYSTQALNRVLARRGGLEHWYPRFVAANLRPRASYAEARHWPPPRSRARVRLTRAEPTARRRTRIDHLSARIFVVRPRPTGRRWSLRIGIDGPGRVSDPAVAVALPRSKGRSRTVFVPLDATGRGSRSIRLGAGVRVVRIALINGSARFRCWRYLPASCQGRAKDDNRRFALSLRLRRR